MKTKKFSKKLNLNKKTVANLGDKEMNGVQAGGQVAASGSACPSCFQTFCGCTLGTCPSVCSLGGPCC